MAGKDINMATAQGLRSEIGGRLARLRLSRNVTQEMLARDAGIAVRTLRRLEAGQPSGLDSFLRVLIALGVGDAVADSLPSGEIRPIERVDARRAERRRARPSKGHAPKAPWSWGGESRD